MSVIDVIRKLLTTRSLMQVITGAVAYHSWEFVFDSLAFRQGVVLPVRPFIILLLFALLATATFVLLVIAWYEWGKVDIPYPEINLIVGSLIFIPFYFEFASYVIYDPRPIVTAQFVRDLFWSYILFPLTVISVLTYTLTLPVFLITSISALVTGAVMRSRQRVRPYSANT